MRVPLPPRAANAVQLRLPLKTEFHISAAFQVKRTRDLGYRVGQNFGRAPQALEN